MEIKIDRYTKVVLTLIAAGLLINAFKDDVPAVHTPFNPTPVQASNIALGTQLQGKGQRFITVSPDGKTVYIWFREEDSQWYDRDKVHYVSQEQVED
ncbi:MAG: hypothetical protein FJY97_07820 [candidate division Zixibacteria bacterium]|nr:hypothetical protein [candidate division Zixibacteria bacterium]